LQELTLDDNKLKSLPKTLDNLINLHTFLVCNNGIEDEFHPMGLFLRMAHDLNAVIMVTRNRFKPNDKEGDKYTEGFLLEPTRESICTASYSGAEFLSWRLLLIRTEIQKTTIWSQLCVFLAEYAKGMGLDEAPSEWHADGKGSPECERLGRYFASADEFPNGEASKSHDKFGCCWFKKWTGNIDAAVQKGHKRFLVFTKADKGFRGIGSVGICQTVEWLYLREIRQLNSHIIIGTQNVEHTALMLRGGFGVWYECKDEPPVGLPM